MTAITETEAGVILRLRVVPRASKTEWAGDQGDAIKLRLQAPPVDGKANKALSNFLSKHFGLPAGRIELLSGHTSRTKRVLLKGLTRRQVHTPGKTGMRHANGG